MAWWLGTVKARDEDPKPEKRKTHPIYTQIPPKALQNPKLYGLTRDAEIYTPQGVVEAMAGDLLFVTEKEIWVIPPEKVPLSWVMKIEDGKS